jgi:hypothetical protein
LNCQPIDYETLSGTVWFASGERDTNILVRTLADNLFEPDEKVTLTLVTNGNAYYLSPNSPNAAALKIHDTF